MFSSSPQLFICSRIGNDKIFALICILMIITRMTSMMKLSKSFLVTIQWINFRMLKGGTYIHPTNSRPMMPKMIVGRHCWHGAWFNVIFGPASIINMYNGIYRESSQKINVRQTIIQTVFYRRKKLFQKKIDIFLADSKSSETALRLPPGRKL